MKSISHKYPLPPFQEVRSSKAPGPISGNPLDWFRKAYNLQSGQRGTLNDYNNLQVIVDDRVVLKSRVNRRPFINRLAAAISKPDEVWTEIDRDNLPAANYLKKYDDGLFKVRVVFGEVIYIDLKDDLEWMEKQRVGFLCFARTVSNSKP